MVMSGGLGLGGGRRARTPVVWAVLAVTVTVFVVSWRYPSLTDRYAQTISAMDAGEYYRLVTYAFLHGSAPHLIVNMATLATIGPWLENEVGSARFLLLYVVAAIGGAVVSIAWGVSASVGASGALFGVSGALVIIDLRSDRDRRRLLIVVTFGVLNLVVGQALPRINMAAHIGGLVTGAAVAAGWEWAKRTGHRSVTEVVATSSIVVLLAGLGAVVGAGEGGTFPVEDIVQRQVEVLRQFGATYDQLKDRPPSIVPQYQAVANGAAAWKVLVLQDPVTPRVVRIDFGDGSSASADIPSGQRVVARVFRHRFPPTLARIRQAASLDGLPRLGTTSGITDVCPGRPTSSPPPGVGDDEPPICYHE